MSKPKPVNWQIIESTSPVSDMILNLMEKYHSEIEGVVIVPMWRHGLKLDPDGFIMLAEIYKSADKYRELREHDLILGINKQVWDLISDHEKYAVIDSQLERIALVTDKEGNPKEDDRSRQIYRIKKEQVVDNEKIFSRHGCNSQTILDYINEKMAELLGD